MTSIIEFLTKSLSSYHVIRNCADKLKQSGFTMLNEAEKFNIDLLPGTKGFYTRNDSAILAFAVGKNYKAGNGATITAAHSDCPSLKIKINPIYSNKSLTTVGMETYGGGLWHTWFDRDLGIAGRVVVNISIKTSIMIQKE